MISYVTLFTHDEFYPGVRTLAHSLFKTGTKIPLLILVTDTVSRVYIDRIAKDISERNSKADSSVGMTVLFRTVEPIENPYKPDVDSWKKCGFTKLAIWSLTGFQKIVYIDADCLILENIDELFEREAPAFAPDVFPPDRFNAGVMVIEPNRDIFETMLDKMQTLKSYDQGDTGFLNAFFSDWFSWPAERRLEFRYNALRTMYWFTHQNPGYWEEVKPIKVLHFCSSPKPWEKMSRMGDLEALWLEYQIST